jgi:hypothetical protein
MTESFRPIPGWLPSTPEVDGRSIADLLLQHPAIGIRFWAAWNGYDPPYHKSLQEVANRFGDRVAFYSCNIDSESNLGLCKHCGISAIPMLVVATRSSALRRIFGMLEPNSLEREIETALLDSPERHKPRCKLLSTIRRILSSK